MDFSEKKQSELHKQPFKLNTLFCTFHWTYRLITFHEQEAGNEDLSARKHDTQQ